MTASSRTNQTILAGEIARLETKLADNALWCELKDLAGRAGDPEAGARRAEIEAGLAADPVYRARSNLLEALELLRTIGEPIAPAFTEDDHETFRAAEAHAAAEVGSFATGESGAIAAAFQDTNLVTATAGVPAAEIPAADDRLKPEAQDSESLAWVESFGAQAPDDTAEAPGTPEEEPAVTAEPWELASSQTLVVLAAETEHSEAEQEPLRSLLEPVPQTLLLSEPSSEEDLAANRPGEATSWALEAAMGDVSGLGALDIESNLAPEDGKEPDPALEPGAAAAPETLEQRLRRLDREAERLVNPAAQSGEDTVKPDHGLARFIERRMASKARLVDRLRLKAAETGSSALFSGRAAEDVEAGPPPPAVMVEAEADRPAPGYISTLGPAAEGVQARPLRARYGANDGRIEEASVEIVRKDVPLRRRFDQSWEQARPERGARSITARFLKALKGD